MKKLLISLVLLFAISTSAQTSFYTDRALSPQSVVGIPSPVMAPIPYGSVRVCSLPLTQQQPCLPLATITDVNGVTISNAIGSNFGQVTTDVTGKFTFGCTIGGNLQVQVQASASNTPALNYPVTCPGSGIQAAGNNSFTGNNTHSGTETFMGVLNATNLDNKILVCSTAGVSTYTTLAAGYAVLTSSGPRQIEVCDGHVETMASTLNMNIPSTGFHFLGKARITCPVAGTSCITAPAGTHGLFLLGDVPFGNNFTADASAVFIYSGSGNAIAIGANTTSTRDFSMDNILINMQGATSGAVGLYMTSVTQMEIRMLTILGNNVSGTTGIVCDGTGNYCGGGHILNPIMQGLQIGIKGIGPGTTTFNATTILSGTISSAVAGNIGIDIENGLGNTILGTDIESESIGIKFGATATDNFARGRFESNTSDVTALTGAAHNRVEVQSASHTITGASDAGTDDHFLYTTDADIRNLNVTGTVSANGLAPVSNGTNLGGAPGVQQWNGSFNALKFANFWMQSIVPTIAGAGCGGSAAAISGTPNGTATFAINVGTTPGSACTITMPSPGGTSTRWVCSATDITTNSTSVFVQKQSPAASQTQTQVVITNFNDVAVATAFTASDIVVLNCGAY